MVVVFGDNLRRKRTAIAVYVIAGLCTIATIAAMALGADAQIVAAFAFGPSLTETVRKALHKAKRR